MVARRVSVYGLGYGRTAPASDVSLVALRAREDAVSEGQESLRLRLPTETDPAESLRVGEPVRIAFTRPEIEVVILDDPDRCSDVALTAAAPRRSRSTASCQRAL